MNIEGLKDYQNACNCMKELNAIPGIKANITAGGLYIDCVESAEKTVVAIAQKFGGVATYGLTEMQERTIDLFERKN